VAKTFQASRREFFRSAVALGGTAVLLTLRGERAPADEPQQPQREPASRGYRLTEHVARYYQTARG
jgi:hypothetical protein